MAILIRTFNNPACRVGPAPGNDMPGAPDEPNHHAGFHRAVCFRQRFRQRGRPPEFLRHGSQKIKDEHQRNFPVRNHRFRRQGKTEKAHGKIRQRRNGRHTPQAKKYGPPICPLCIKNASEQERDPLCSGFLPGIEQRQKERDKNHQEADGQTKRQALHRKKCASKIERHR